MNLSRVIDLLRELEGWRDYVYDDQSPWPRSEVGRLDCRYEAGQYKVSATGGTATIGYGETEAAFIDRYWGKRITQAEALAKMGERVEGFYRAVQGCIEADLTEHQWEAITCRAYQTGAGGFCRSIVAQALNEGDTETALTAWRRNFAHPDRSEVEIAHFLTPDEKEPPVEHRIIPRAEWGAKPVSGMVEASYPMEALWLHHSDTAPTDDPSADMRQLQQIAFSRGFADVSYTFGLHPDGPILEGRDLRYVGAHTAGNNSTSLAFVLIGNYDDIPPTDEQIASARWLRDHLIDEGYLTPGTYPTGGHQDAPGNQTGCPGAMAEARLDLFRAPQDDRPPKPDPQGDPHMLTFRYIYDGLDWVFDGPSRLFFHADDTDQITQVLDVIGVPALGQVSGATHRRYSQIAETAGFTG